MLQMTQLSFYDFKAHLKWGLGKTWNSWVSEYDISAVGNIPTSPFWVPCHLTLSHLTPCQLSLKSTPTIPNWTLGQLALNKTQTLSNWHLGQLSPKNSTQKLRLGFLCMWAWKFHAWEKRQIPEIFRVLEILSDGKFPVPQNSYSRIKMAP